jgi:hypothetical protein
MGGEHADAHEPHIRRMMAQTLARMIELAEEVEVVGAIHEGWAWPKEALWPVPHNALFDFSASGRGAEWIDHIAARAKEVVDGFNDRVVVGHADWSVKHFRFEAGRICAVFDWDSLRLDKETTIVGTAAATFPATWYIRVSSRAPSPDEMRLFIEEYEEARGEPFTAQERVR